MNPLDVKGSLLEGAVAEQRRKGKMPTPEVAESYFTPILERLERTPKQRVAPKPHAERTAAEKVERCNRVARKFGVQGRWELTDEVNKGAIKVAPPLSKRERQLKKMLRHRVRLLSSKSDWRARLGRINPLALNGTLGHDKQMHAYQLLLDLIKKSDETFGDWARPKPKKLWSYKGQAKRS